MLCEFEIFGVCGICLVVVRRLSRKNSCMWHYCAFCGWWSTLANVEIVNEWNSGLKFIYMLAIFKFCSTQFLLINTGRTHLANLRLLLVYTCSYCREEGDVVSHDVHPRAVSMTTNNKRSKNMFTAGVQIQSAKSHPSLSARQVVSQPT